MKEIQIALLAAVVSHRLIEAMRPHAEAYEKALLEGDPNQDPGEFEGLIDRRKGK